MSGRVEIITGPERRRRWSDEEKLQLLAEKNANQPARELCRLTFAWLHVEAMDFQGAGARELCEGVDDRKSIRLFLSSGSAGEGFRGIERPATQSSSLRSPPWLK
jgi:hypothetical protein